MLKFQGSRALFPYSGILGQKQIFDYILGETNAMIMVKGSLEAY